MSQHISRKELKEDKIARTLAHGVEEVASHQRQAWYVGAAVLVVLAAVFGWRVWSERQNTQAETAFREAKAIYDARIRAAGEPEEPGERTYVDEKNKYADAAKKFADVAGQFSLTRHGRTARYYAGLSYVALGNDEEAQKWLNQVEGSSDPELAALARFQLAALYARLGKTDLAVSRFKELISNPTTMVPKQTAMMALADFYRKTNPAEAEKLYTQIKTEYPNSGYAEQADDRLAELKPKS